MINCKNCSTAIDSNFCGNCGQPIQIKRVDGHYVFHEIQHILHFEKGILYTIKELLIRPEKNIKEFITDNRSRLVKPIVFIIISSLIYTVIIHFFHIEKQYMVFSGNQKTTVSSIFTWVQNHYGYANIIMGIFIALWLKLFFRRYQYNFFEILILLCFVIGMGMLIFSVFAIFEGLTKVDVMKFSGILSFAYCTIAIAQFFDRNRVASYFKALASYILGMLTFCFSCILLGVLLDLLIK